MPLPCIKLKYLLSQNKTFQKVNSSVFWKKPNNLDKNNLQNVTNIRCIFVVCILQSHIIVLKTTEQYSEVLRIERDCKE